MAANPSISLKLGAVAFAVLWTLWMLSWSGSLDRVNVIMLSLCGAIVGYAWYRAMRWQFRRNGRWPQQRDSAN
jgi:membrane protease YdiL (CAAX protease family)